MDKGKEWKKKKQRLRLLARRKYLNELMKKQNYRCYFCNHSITRFKYSDRKIIDKYYVIYKGALFKIASVEHLDGIQNGNNIDRMVACCKECNECPWTRKLI